MQDKHFVPFTKEMKKQGYTILVPNMLGTHFKLAEKVVRSHGYNVEVLDTSGPQVIETGLRYTHNDACYPAMFVVGQFMDALNSGKYDPHKTALMMYQTGGGCRASNYISLIRKALKKAGMEYIPVISFSLGVEKHPGFKVTVPLIYELLYAIFYGDLIMSLANEVRPCEINIGDADRLTERLTQELGDELGAGKNIRHSQIRKNYRMIVQEFAAIPIVKRDAVKVGVVGEIFVKYSALANNHLQRFLEKEGAEVIMPGLMDFLCYCMFNACEDRGLFGSNAYLYPIYKMLYKFMCRSKDEISKIITENSDFRGWTPFPEIAGMAEGYISTGVKMGEGWLLTAEMVELSSIGCKNIVCAQPFGCLPNHICGKGMMQRLNEKNPDVNIVAIDYDASASRVNQENRLKLMLFNANRVFKSVVHNDNDDMVA